MTSTEMSELLESLGHMEDKDARLRVIFRALDTVYLEQIAQSDDDADAEIDPGSMRYFTDLVSYMAEIARENNGRVEVDFREPKESTAGITINLRVRLMSGSQLRFLCKLLVWAADCSVDVQPDGSVCLSARYVGVYR